MEYRANSSLEDVSLEKAKAEITESESLMNSADSGEEKDGKIDQHDCTGEVGGYNKDRPPDDDCCPICFGEFQFPSRTSCGHWFCSSCILELWKYSTSLKPCKCPMCSSLIVRLVPELSVMNQTGEEVRKIRNKIQQYNNLTGGGFMGLFLKVLAFPMLIRRMSREYFSPVMLRNVYNMMRLSGVLLLGHMYNQNVLQYSSHLGVNIYILDWGKQNNAPVLNHLACICQNLILLSLLYDSYNFRFFPSGGMGIQLLFQICGYAVVVILIVDVIWHKCMLRRGARRLAQQPDVL